MAFFERSSWQNLVERSKFGEGHFAHIMSDIYAQTATLPLPDTITGCPLEFEECVNLVYSAAGQKNPQYKNTPKTEVVSKARDDKRIIVAYSGGNDSTATVLKLIEQGYDPILFYVRKINSSYPNEHDVVVNATEKFAQIKFGIKLVTAHARLTTSMSFKEHPMKDQLIMALMADYGAANGISMFATGNEEENLAEDSNVMYNFSDCLEMHKTASKWFSAAMPSYRLVYGIKSRGDSIATLLRFGQDWLEHTMCCMLPYRYQASRKAANEAKFGIKLGKNRCGSCYKCCAEYLCLIGQRSGVEYSTEFARHCWEFFKQRLDVIYTPAYGKGKTEDELLSLALDDRYTNIDLVKQVLAG